MQSYYENTSDYYRDCAEEKAIFDTDKIQDDSNLRESCISREGIVEFLIPMCPPSANRLWRCYNGHNVLSKEAQEFYNVASMCELHDLPGGWKYVDVDLTIVPTRRRVDIDNRVKAVLDAMTKCHAWIDDEIVASLTVRMREPDKKIFPRGAVFIVVKKSNEKYTKLTDIEKAKGTQPWTK